MYRKFFQIRKIATFEGLDKIEAFFCTKIKGNGLKASKHKACEAIGIKQANKARK
jgi:hypothetical protein